LRAVVLRAVVLRRVVVRLRAEEPAFRVVLLRVVAMGHPLSRVKGGGM
jgi:hypothetical protein